MERESGREIPPAQVTLMAQQIFRAIATRGNLVRVRMTGIQEPSPDARWVGSMSGPAGATGPAPAQPSSFPTDSPCNPTPTYPSSFPAAGPFASAGAESSENVPAPAGKPTTSGRQALSRRDDALRRAKISTRMQSSAREEWDQEMMIQGLNPFSSSVHKRYMLGEIAFRGKEAALVKAPIPCDRCLERKMDCLVIDAAAEGWMITGRCVGCVERSRACYMSS